MDPSVDIGAGALIGYRLASASSRMASAIICGLLGLVSVYLLSAVTVRVLIECLRGRAVSAQAKDKALIQSLGPN
jgi:uncharacterized membrane protein